MLQKLSIGKKTQNQIAKMFTGNKKQPAMGARTIARELGVPHRQVMTYLQKEGFAKYSEGSYA
jgi:hypothetical protein